MFGSALAAELDEVEGKNSRQIKLKRSRIIARWIPEASEDSQPKKYRDPGNRGQG